MGKEKKKILNDANIKYLGVFLSISFLSMSGMNLSSALQQISVAFPEQSSESIQSLVTLPSLFVVFTSFIAGPLSKIISRKRTILLGSLIFVIAGSLPSLTSSFNMIRLSRMLIGCGLGIMQPLSSTIMFSLFNDPYERNTIMGWSSCGTALGSVISTNLAGILAGINYKLTFLVHLVGLLTFFMNLIFLPQDKVDRKTINKEKNKNLGFYQRIRNQLSENNLSIFFWFVMIFIYMGFLNAFSTKIALLVGHYSIGNPSVSALGITLLTVGSFLGSFIFGRISQILKTLTLGIGIAISACGLFFLAIGIKPLPIYLSGILTGFGMSMTTPCILIKVVENSGETNRTMAIAINSAMSNLGLSLSPYLTAWTTVLFFGKMKTIKNEYLISAAVLFIIGLLFLIFESFVKKSKIERFIKTKKEDVNK